MSAIGIDLGSFRTVIAAVSGGGVEILINESSYRETRNLVGFGRAERLLGDAAQAKMNNNFKNTCSYFTRLLNLPFDHPDLKKEKKHLCAKIVKSEDGRCSYSVLNQGERADITPVQALAAHFTKIVEVLKLNKITHKDLVVTVPSYFSIGEKKSVYAAGAAAGVNIAQVVDEAVCNIKNYALFRRRDLLDDYRSVAFVDFGHSKLSVFVAEICKKDARIIAERSLRHCGTRDLDLALYEFFRQKFLAESSCDTNEDPKAQLKLMAAVANCREILSGNEDFNLNVEFLMEENDFSASITRQEFHSICKPVFDNIRRCFAETIAASGIAPKSLNSVEIIGGGTRIPIVQEIILQESGLDIVSKTLDQSESCARGAAIKAAEVSPTISVVQYPINFLCQHSIKCRYQMFKRSENETKELTGSLFKKGTKLINTMSVTVANTPGSYLDVFYDDAELPDREEGPIYSVETGLLKPKEEEYKLILRTKVDDSLIPFFKGAELEEYYTEEVRKEVKKPAPKPEDPAKMDLEGGEAKMDEEPQFEVSHVKKTRITKVNVTDKTQFFYTLEVINRYKELEAAMHARDEEIRSTNRARNDLEALIYSSRSAVDSEWSEFISEADKQAILDTSSALEGWVYGEGENVEKSQYLARLKEFQSKTIPIEERIAAHNAIEAAAGYMFQRLEMYRSEIPQNTEKYAHLTEEDRISFEKELGLMERELNSLNGDRAGYDKKALPPVLATSIYKQISEHEKVLDKILKKPKPEPKKEEPAKMEEEVPKAEEKMEEEANAGKEAEEKN